MSIFGRKKTRVSGAAVAKPRRRWVRALLIAVAIIAVIGGAVLWKTGSVLNKISVGKAGLFKNIVGSLPGNEQKLKGEDTGRVNILLLGMRGEGVGGGDLLADTIMVFSYVPADTKAGTPAKVSLVSIPRDLYVTVPAGNEQRKINAVYALGEERVHGGGGMEDMRTMVGKVTGLDIPYAVAINFKGFTDLVNALGGVTVNLKEPFDESQQFHEAQVCDSYTYTVPTKPAQYQYKYRYHSDGTKTIVKAYPMCYNHDEECGGDFKLPAGVNTLDGAKALCYARSRYTSSDFKRAGRQQEVIQAIKDKALSVGTLADFGKINAILNSLGDNVRTNLEGWEMKRLLDIYTKNSSMTLTQKVLDDSDGGLLYAPPETKETGYILLPLGDTYDRIHSLFQNVP